MTDIAASTTDLVALGEDVVRPDAGVEAMAQARAGDPSGRLAEIRAWLATTQGRYPAQQPVRPRCVVIGAVGGAGAIRPAVAAIAETFGVGIRALELPADATVAGAYAAGLAVADAEVDSGTDLLVLADPDPSASAAVLVAALTGAEPVAMLPRGAQATDTAAWVERAEHLRDTRRTVNPLRGRPDELLLALASPSLAAAVALLLRAVARRTPVILDGTAAVAAALLANDLQPLASRWWRVADSSPDPVHARGVAEFGRPTLLDLSTSIGDGTAGLLSVALLRAAAHGGESA